MVSPSDHLLTNALLSFYMTAVQLYSKRRVNSFLNRSLILADNVPDCSYLHISCLDVIISVDFCYVSIYVFFSALRITDNCCTWHCDDTTILVIFFLVCSMSTVTASDFHNGSIAPWGRSVTCFQLLVRCLRFVQYTGNNELTHGSMNKKAAMTLSWKNSFEFWFEFHQSLY